MKKVVTLVFLFVSCYTFSQSKAYSTIKKVRDNSNKVANQFLKMDIDNLFEDLKPYWVISNDQIDTVKVRTKGLVPEIQNSFGEGIDAIKIKEINLENAILQETYFIRYLKSAIRIKITYYNNSKGWFINTFEWDDKISEELD